MARLPPSAGALALVAAGLTACMGGDRTPIGGHWYTEHRQSMLAEAGGGLTSLVRRTALWSVTVDDIIGRTQYVGDECVLYEGRHYYEQIWAVCGAGKPRLLIPDTQSYESHDTDGNWEHDWRLDAKGVVRIVQMAPRDGGGIVKHGQILSMSDAKALAQVPGPPHAREDRTFDPAVQARIRPVQYVLSTREQLDARQGEREPTVLMRASGEGRADLVAAALRAGADPNTRDDLGGSALLGASSKYPDIVALLLRAGAAVDPVDSHGRTPLMLAVHDENREAIRSLLEAGANPCLKDSWGESALDYARPPRELPEVVARLEKACAPGPGVPPSAPTPTAARR